MPTSRIRSIAFWRASAFATLLVEDDRLHDLRADGEDRVERGHRLLEDHADVAAANRLHLALGQADEVAPRNEMRPVSMLAFDDSSRMIESDVTLLPEPLSPTMPSVRPSSRRNERSSTARNDAFLGVEVSAEIGDF